MAIRTAIGARPPQDLRILIADDDLSTVRLIKRILDELGVQVNTAFDGEDALEQIRSHTFDLAILDVMMPRKDGFEVLKAIRQNPETENLPVVILTAKNQDADIYNGYQYGADMYLTKPFNPEEIRNLIRMIP